MHKNTANKVHSYSHLALTEREEIAIGIELPLKTKDSPDSETKREHDYSRMFSKSAPVKQGEIPRQPSPSAEQKTSERKPSTRATQIRSYAMLYLFQNRIQVSNRVGSIFFICDQSDLEAGFHFGLSIVQFLDRNNDYFGTGIFRPF